MTLSGSDLKVFERQSNDSASEVTVALERALQPGAELDAALQEHFGITFST